MAELKVCPCCGRPFSQWHENGGEPRLFVEYRNGMPHAYRYGEEWEAQRFLMEGGFTTKEEAIREWERENKYD